MVLCADPKLREQPSNHLGSGRERLVQASAALPAVDFDLVKGVSRDYPEWISEA